MSEMIQCLIFFKILQEKKNPTELGAQMVK